MMRLLTLTFYLLLSTKLFATEVPYTSEYDRTLSIIEKSRNLRAKLNENNREVASKSYIVNEDVTTYENFMETAGHDLE